MSSQDIGALLIGIATGLMAGVFGVGGGIVATPLLRLLLGLTAHEAIGTTLAIIVPTSLAGSINYYRQKLVDFKMVRWLVGPAILTSYLGVQTTALVNGQHLMIYFALLVVLAALDMLTGFSHKLKDKKKQAEGAYEYVAPSGTKILPVGLLAGFLSGFFGVGGGFIMIPIFISLFNMPVKMALGTSLVCIAIISVPGTIAHFYLDHVRFTYVLMLVLGAVPASMLGSKLAIMIKDNWLRRGFGTVMLIMAATIVYREFAN